MVVVVEEDVVVVFETTDVVVPDETVVVDGRAVVLTAGAVVVVEAAGCEEVEPGLGGTYDEVSQPAQTAATSIINRAQLEARIMRILDTGRAP